MKNIASFCIIIYCTIFHVESASKEGYFNCSDRFIFAQDPLYYAVACVSFENKTLAIPQTIPRNIHFLIVSMLSNSYGALMIENIDTFLCFSNLVAIGITIGKGFEISDHLLEPNQLKALKNELFNVPSLTYLEIIYLEFNSKNHNWILPASLKNLRIMNSVFEYDLRKCIQLETLQLTHNNFNKMPILSNPAPPLKELSLRSNPLQEFKVNDIAGYCDLRSLSMDQTNMSYCECLRLIKWIRKNLKEVEGFKFNGVLECQYGEGLDCSNHTLHEADLLREKCIQRKVWNVVLWLIAIFASIAVMILACFFINYKLIEMRMKQMRESGEE